MRVGTDLSDIRRWKRMKSSHPQRFLTIFREEEIAHCESKGAGCCASYAALWATREAAAKALGMGIGLHDLRDIHVTWTKAGMPILRLEGRFAAKASELNIEETALSISHEGDMALAVVVMTGGRHAHNDE